MKSGTIVLMCFFSCISFAQIPSFYKIDTVCYNKDYKTLNYHLGDSIVFKQMFLHNKLQYESTKINGKANGIQRDFYPNGQLKWIRNYILDVPIGVWISYYENGNIKSLYDYGYSANDINLKLQGKSFVEIDIVTGEESGWALLSYKPLNGKYYFYYETGILEEIKEYNDGEIVHIICFDPSGIERETINLIK